MTTSGGGPADASGATDGVADPEAPGDAPGYAEALAELEEILAELEDDGIDVDLLAAKVTRASALIRLCRDRIGAARLQVERVVADLEDLARPGASGTDAGVEGDEGDESDGPA